MGYFSDLNSCEADQDEEEDGKEINTHGKEVKADVKEDGIEVNVDVELEEKAEAGLRLRQHKRPGLLRTRLEIAFFLLDPFLIQFSSLINLYHLLLCIVRGSPNSSCLVISISKDGNDQETVLLLMKYVHCTIQINTSTMSIWIVQCACLINISDETEYGQLNQKERI